MGVAEQSDRTDLRIPSGGDELAAWWYRPTGVDSGTCVVMAHGFSLTRHDGLPRFAEAFATAGAHVLLFDHRFLGDSGGEPRQRFRAPEQRADWAAALAHARTLDGVTRIVLWGYSFSGGHVVHALGRGAEVAAAMVLCPFVDGLPRVLGTPPGLVAWILPRALADLAGHHVTIPVTGEPGTRGAMTLPGEAAGFARAVPPGSPWRNEISPGLFATVALMRPVTRARRIGCPLWVGRGERDITVDGAAVAKLAGRAPRGELREYPHDHFDPFVGEAPARIAADQIAFLRRCELL